MLAAQRLAYKNVSALADCPLAVEGALPNEITLQYLDLSTAVARFLEHGNPPQLPAPSPVVENQVAALLKRDERMRESIRHDVHRHSNLRPERKVHFFSTFGRKKESETSPLISVSFLLAPATSS